MDAAGSAANGLRFQRFQRFQRFLGSRSSKSPDQVPPYQEKYPVGVAARIGSRERLRAFARDWKFHHPLEAEQIAFAGMTDIVKAVGFYHGGDVLYTLVHAPGTWHEHLLDSQ